MLHYTKLYFFVLCYVTIYSHLYLYLHVCTRFYTCIYHTEHGYTEAWRNYLQGNRPRHITVDDQRYQPLTTRFDFKNLNDDDEEDEEEVMSESQSESRSSVTDRVEEQEEEEDSMADDDYGYGDETDIYLKYMD